MTDSPDPKPRKMDRTSALVALAILGVFLALQVLLPEERVDAATGGLVTLLGVLGLVATVRGSAIPGGSLAGLGALLRDVLGRRSSSPPPRRVPPPPSSRDGFATIRSMLLPLALAVGWVVLSMYIHGCGSSLASHATAAHVMGLALDGAYDVAEAHAVEATEACVTAGDEACVHEVHESMTPVAIGLTGLEVAWSGYVSAIEVGHLSGASEGLLEAMRSAAARMLAAYSLLADALSRVGVALPAVPPMVLALLGDPS